MITFPKFALLNHFFLVSLLTKVEMSDEEFFIVHLSSLLASLGLELLLRRLDLLALLPVSIRLEVLLPTREDGFLALDGGDRTLAAAVFSLGRTVSLLLDESRPRAGTSGGKRLLIFWLFITQLRISPS